MSPSEWNLRKNWKIPLSIFKNLIKNVDSLKQARMVLARYAGSRMVLAIQNGVGLTPKPNQTIFESIQNFETLRSHL